MIQAVLVRICEAKPRCMHILECDDKMALVRDFGIPDCPEQGSPAFRIPLTYVYEWHEVRFDWLDAAYRAGQTAALAGLWQNTPLWKRAAPAWKPHLLT